MMENIVEYPWRIRQWNQTLTEIEDREAPILHFSTAKWNGGFTGHVLLYNTDLRTEVVKNDYRAYWAL